MSKIQDYTGPYKEPVELDWDFINKVLSDEIVFTPNTIETEKQKARKRLAKFKNERKKL